jgi:hypothetical protein
MIPAVEDHHDLLFALWQIHLPCRLLGFFLNCLMEELNGSGFGVALEYVAHNVPMGNNALS